MTSFDERTRDAMQASMIGSLAELSQRTASRKLITEVRLREILRDPESVSGRELITLGRVLRVRFGWLMDGDGPVTPVTHTDPREVEVLMLYSSIPPAKIRFWFGMGRRLAK